MTLDELVEKLKQKSISQGEQEQLCALVSEELESLKKKEPQKYLEFVRTLNRAMSDLNQALEAA